MSSERIQRRIVRLWGEAKLAADSDDWEAARHIAEDILAIEPGNREAQAYIVSELQFKIGHLLSQALTAAEGEDWEASRQFAEAILALDPSNEDAQGYTALALHKHNLERTLSQAKAAADGNEFESSIMFATMALSMDPDNVTAQFYLVQGKVEQLLDKVEGAADVRNWEEVRLLTEEILAIDPENGDADIYSNAAYRMLDKSGLPEGLSDVHQKGHYEIVVDSVAGVATIRGDRLTTIPRDEFVILASLYRNRGRLVKLQQIRAECASFFYFESPSMADQKIERCIRSLRQKIEEDPSDPKIIRDGGGSEDSYIIAPIVELSATVSDAEGSLISELADARRELEFHPPTPLLGEQGPLGEDSVPSADDDEDRELAEYLATSLGGGWGVADIEDDKEKRAENNDSADAENMLLDGDEDDEIATLESDSEQDISDQTSSLTLEEYEEKVRSIVWSVIRNELGYGIPWVSDQEDVSDDLPTVRLGWEVANSVAVGISEYLDTNFNVVEDSDELFHVIYEDVELEVETWDGTTAEVIAGSSDYFAPWFKALEDIVETAIPNIANGAVGSLEALEIQVDKMLETIHIAAEHFTYKWIDDSVNSIVEVGLGQVERLVQDLVEDESDDMDIDQAATDARVDIQPEVMEAVGWFIRDAQSTLSPKLENNYDTVSTELMTALETMGPIAKNSASQEIPDTSWGDDILSLVVDTTS